MVLGSPAGYSFSDAIHRQRTETAQQTAEGARELNQVVYARFWLKIHGFGCGLGVSCEWTPANRTT